MRSSHNIYLASSWRNAAQPFMVNILRAWGYDVYDFRNPAPGNHGFAWAEIDPAWETWTTEQYLAALDHPVAKLGYGLDMDALEDADTVLLLQPCGRSAHLELGYAVGAGKKTGILVAEGEPELMVKMVDWMGNAVGDLEAWLEGTA